MSERLEVWRCPECGGASYYWHFSAADGYGLIAVLQSTPDFSSLEAAKTKALQEHDEEMSREENR